MLIFNILGLFHNFLIQNNLNNNLVVDIYNLGLKWR